MQPHFIFFWQGNLQVQHKYDTYTGKVGQNAVSNINYGFIKNINYKYVLIMNGYLNSRILVKKNKNKVYHIFSIFQSNL